MSHKIIKCGQCDTIIMQCRCLCLNGKKTVEKSTCEKCRDKSRVKK